MAAAASVRWHPVARCGEAGGHEFPADGNRSRRQGRSHGILARMAMTASSRRRLARRQALGAALGLALPGAASRAAAPWQAARPVTLTVPYAAGGSADTLARPLAEGLARQLGVPVVIENRPGAQTAIAAEAVARAAPDGHRLLLTASATLTLNPLLRRDLPYRVEDFAPVAHLATLPYAVAARAGVPSGLAAFVAHVGARPGRVSLGHLGPGSSLHLAGARIAARLGLSFLEVTYRSDVLAANDLMAGVLDAAVLGGPAAMVAARSGRARLVAWTAAARLPDRPEEAVFAEAWPDLVATGWLGLHVPAATPPAAIARLNAACAAALRADPGLRERLRAEGVFVAEVGPPESFAAYLACEAERIGALLARIGLQPGP